MKFAKVKLLSLLALFTTAVPNGARAQITAELIDAARKEGEVMFYAAITIKSSKAIGDLFEKHRKPPCKWGWLRVH